jgi:hypothetical protein
MAGRGRGARVPLALRGAVTHYSRTVNARPHHDGREVSGRQVLVGVLALVLLLAAGIVLQAVLADRTGISHRAPTVRYGDGGASLAR